MQRTEGAPQPAEMKRETAGDPIFQQSPNDQKVEVTVTTNTHEIHLYTYPNVHEHYPSDYNDEKNPAIGFADF